MDEHDKADGAAMAPADDRSLMFHLWLLVKTMRESADISFGAITPLPALGRHVLLILHRDWGQTFPTVCAQVGKDKAQVSRALGQLEEAGFVLRERARGPLALTAKGEALSQRLMAMAQARNEGLLAGLAPAAIADVHAVTELLILRASMLYETERQACGDNPLRPSAPEWYDGGDPDPSRPGEIALLLPRLMALLAYGQRSMTLAAKRLVGMPAFDTLLLSFVVARAPLPQATLVAMLDRDQSQAARTIRRLIADGLIVRTAASTRRSILLAPTDKGLAVNAVMATEVARRDAFLGGAVAADRLGDLRVMLGRLSVNAAAIAAAAARGTTDHPA